MMRKLAGMLGLLALIGVAAVAQDRARPPAPAGPGEAPKARTVYVPALRLEGLSRAESLRLTEIIAREIEATTPLKVVGEADQADLTFEATLRPGDRPRR